MEPSKGRICTWKLTLTFCTVGKLSSVHTQRWFWSLTGQQTVLWHGFPCGWSKWNGGATNLILILVPCNVAVLQFYMYAFWFFFFQIIMWLRNGEECTPAWFRINKSVVWRQSHYRSRLSPGFQHVFSGAKPSVNVWPWLLCTCRKKLDSRLTRPLLRLGRLGWEHSCCEHVKDHHRLDNRSLNCFRV